MFGNLNNVSNHKMPQNQTENVGGTKTKLPFLSNFVGSKEKDDVRKSLKKLSITPSKRHVSEISNSEADLDISINGLKQARN